MMQNRRMVPCRMGARGQGMGARPTVGRQVPYDDIGMTAGVSGMACTTGMIGGGAGMIGGGSGMVGGSGMIMGGSAPMMSPMVGGSGMMMGGSAPMMSQAIGTTRPRGFNGFWPSANVMRQGLVAGGQPMIMGGGQSSVRLVKGPIPIQVAQPQRMIVQQPMVIQQPMMIQQPRVVQQPVMIQQPRIIQQPVMIQQPRVIQQPVMIQQPRIVQQPVMIQQPMVMQQPRMAVQQHPMLMNQGVQVVPQSGVQNFGTQVQDYQISPLVTERHIIQQTKKIIRKTRKPVRKQVGTQMVPTVEEVVVQNPDTMKMATEYAEPYIKRDGYTTDNVGVINQKTKVIRRSGFPTRKTSLRTVPVLTNQVTTTGRVGMMRGYTRIDTWKHCGDAQ